MSALYSIVFITVGNEAEANSLGRKLVEESLVACVGMIPQKSIYSWRGEVVEDNEVLLIIKTKTDMFDQIKETVLKSHSYEVPEIIRITIQEGHAPYLQWIEDTVRTPN
jgi:periplasmic divalent cation tolerance protein